MFHGLRRHVARWQRRQMGLVCIAWVLSATIVTAVLFERDRARVAAGITARLHGNAPPNWESSGIQHRYNSFSGPIENGVMRVEHIWLVYPAWVKPLVLFSLLVPPLGLRALWRRSRRAQHRALPPPPMRRHLSSIHESSD